LIVLTLLSVVFFAGCTPRSGPKLPGETFDAGAIFATVTPALSHRFRVENTTGRRVRILSENHSCDCTTVELEKRDLLPGDSMLLSMSVRVAPLYSNKDVSCVLKTDQPERSEWTYRLRFESFPEARIVPDRIDLGTFSVAEISGAGKHGEIPSAEAWLEVFAQPNQPDLAAPRVAQPPEEYTLKLGERPELSTLANGVRLQRHPLSIGLKQGISSAGPGYGPSTFHSGMVRAPPRLSFGQSER